MKEMTPVRRTMEHDCRFGGIMNSSFVNVCLTVVKIRQLYLKDFIVHKWCYIALNIINVF